MTHRCSRRRGTRLNTAYAVRFRLRHSRRHRPRNLPLLHQPHRLKPRHCCRTPESPPSPSRPPHEPPRRHTRSPTPPLCAPIRPAPARPVPQTKCRPTHLLRPKYSPSRRATSRPAQPASRATPPHHSGTHLVARASTPHSTALQHRGTYATPRRVARPPAHTLQRCHTRTLFCGTWLCQLALFESIFVELTVRNTFFIHIPNDRATRRLSPFIKP